MKKRPGRPDRAGRHYSSNQALIGPTIQAWIDEPPTPRRWRLRTAGQLLKIELLDHAIVGRSSHTSLRSMVFFVRFFAGDCPVIDHAIRETAN